MKLLVTADWHLTEEKPRCRLDKDWIGTQKKIISWMFVLAEKEKAHVTIIGDWADKSIISPVLVNYFLQRSVSLTNYSFINNFKVGLKTYILGGNHDYPYHNFENKDRSSFGTLWALVGKLEENPNGFIRSFSEIGMAGHWNKDPVGSNEEIVGIHILAYKKTIPPYIKGAVTAQDLKNRFPKAKYIFTGDNHSNWVKEIDGTLIINPGCLIRQAADKINYQPVVYLVDTETGEFEAIEVPDKMEMVTDEYITVENERGDRIDAFVESVKSGKKIGLNFIKNLKRKMGLNKRELGSSYLTIETLLEEIKG